MTSSMIMFLLQWQWRTDLAHCIPIEQNISSLGQRPNIAVAMSCKQDSNFARFVSWCVSGAAIDCTMSAQCLRVCCLLSVVFVVVCVCVCVRCHLPRYAFAFVSDVLFALSLSRFRFRACVSCSVSCFVLAIVVLCLFFLLHSQIMLCR